MHHNGEKFYLPRHTDNKLDTRETNKLPKSFTKEHLFTGHQREKLLPYQQELQNTESHTEIVFPTHKREILFPSSQQQISVTGTQKGN